MVQEYALSLLLGRLGPLAGYVRELLAENAALREERDALVAENRRLEARVEARRTMKRRSPAEWRFRVRRWELGEQTFQPKGEPQPITTPNLRIHIALDDPSEGAPYWDITSKRLIAMLLPILPHIAGTGTYVEISKTGDGVQAQYSMAIRPA